MSYQKSDGITSLHPVCLNFRTLHLFICSRTWNNTKDQIVTHKIFTSRCILFIINNNFYRGYIFGVSFCYTNHFFPLDMRPIKFLKIVNYSYLKMFFYLLLVTIFLRARFSACWIGMAEISHVFWNPILLFLLQPPLVVKWAVYWILASRMREKSIPGLDSKLVPRKEVKRQCAFSMFPSLDCWQYIQWQTLSHRCWHSY